MRCARAAVRWQPRARADAFFGASLPRAPCAYLRAGARRAIARSVVNASAVPTRRAGRSTAFSITA
eukprot:10159742-Lingulodinium_polyedra.AAC.1